MRAGCSVFILGVAVIALALPAAHARALNDPRQGASNKLFFMHASRIGRVDSSTPSEPRLLRERRPRSSREFQVDPKSSESPLNLKHRRSEYFIGSLSDLPAGSSAVKPGIDSPKRRLKYTKLSAENPKVIPMMGILPPHIHERRSDSKSTLPSGGRKSKARRMVYGWIDPQFDENIPGSSLIELISHRKIQ